MLHLAYKTIWVRVENMLNSLIGFVTILMRCTYIILLNIKVWHNVFISFTHY